ncbi:BTAD domain-containing putative transcriptional regulator [Tengunoibacter tsumagoiensis]|uniref:Bacterial transcriptional activator domain-containing protein n=1 Tax=Tengunoibacter tsumagoiensis TaxID=2014871 RepID=A0A402A0Z4_9CHLR|nr:BTAD domain-containing putative transcriptional regulator [Tengunoibacter tsumagoiensis]GCE12818.1 hypothetical protein KTT_26770 [Tengunoibacter tsumagoiensis]
MEALSLEVLDAWIHLLNERIAERFAFFLCHYQHVAKNSLIAGMINRFLRHVTANCVLVIESRVLPNLQFVHLLAHRQVLSINSKDLSFTAEEVYHLAQIQEVHDFTYKEAERIATDFEGWVAGILLGTRVGGQQFLHTPGRGASQLSPHLFQYLETEIFRDQENLYSFVREAALFQHLVPTICASVLGREDAEQVLARLEEQGLFVTLHGSGSHIFYTCHPILRRLLLDHLREQCPEQCLRRHRQALTLFLAAGDEEQALYHALEGESYDIFVRLLLKNADTYLAQNRVELLTFWLERIPVEIKKSYPRLSLVQANIALMNGNYTVALEQLATSPVARLDAMVEQEDTVDHRLRIEQEITRSKALFQAGELHQAKALCQQILKRLSDDELALRCEVHLRLGVCLNLLGETAPGIQHLQRALQLNGRHTLNRQAADTHSALANAYSISENFTLAEHHLSRSLLCWEEFHDERGKITSLLQRGILKQRQGLLTEAEEDLQQALALARGPVRFLRGEAYALANLADLFLDQDKLIQALTVAEESLALAGQLKDKRLAVYCLYKLAMVYLLKGDSSTALLFISEIRAPEDGSSIDSYEYNMSTIAYGTVLLYQQRYEEALAFLVEKKAAFASSPRVLVQLLISLALCRLSLLQDEAFVSTIDEICCFFTSHGSYRNLALVELRRHPALLQAIKSRPDMQQLRGLLLLEEEPSHSVHAQKTVHVVSATKPQISPPQEESLTLRIVAFGEPAVIIGGKPVTHWRMARSMELLFFFLHMGRPLRKEEILTALWSDVDEQTESTLYTTIYYLRKILGHSKCITSHAGTYKLDLTPVYGKHVWYDVAEFQHYYQQAQTALACKEIAVMREKLLAMIHLYQGDYLRSIYSDWCRTQRDEARTLYLNARRSLGQIALDEKAFDESIMHWQRMLALDNCLEEAHLGIMICSVELGKRGLAIRQYQQCREILHQELGVEPGHALQDLYQRLKAAIL